MTIALVGEGGAQMVLRDTPWDARALGRPTLDIVSLALATEQGIGTDDDLFQAFDDICREHRAGLITVRLSAERRVAVSRLQTAGFRYVETVLRLRYANLARFALPATGRAMALREARPEDAPALIEQAAGTFRYGRFAEDPAIDPEVNRRRQIDWMEGLLAGKARVLVSDVGEKPGAFLAFRVEDGTAEFVLGGTRPEQAVLAHPFWSAVLGRLRQDGVRRVETVISAANLGVLNLYARLGFQAHETLIGLHLHRP
ncbi:GNAT family N-acetyltransferase [Phreatobacter sp. HK31-P]